MKTFTLVLDKTNYFTLRALFLATSTDATRQELGRVLYDAKRRLFIATDGYIMRLQGLEGEWFKDGIEPDFNFVLNRKDFLTTAAQWKAAGDFVREVEGIACFMGRAYESGSAEYGATFPEWSYAIAPAGIAGHVAQGFDPELVARFTASFLDKPKMLVFVPGVGVTSGSHIFVRGHYAGIIMPLKVLDGFAPDLAEIEAVQRGARELATAAQGEAVEA